MAMGYPYFSSRSLSLFRYKCDLIDQKCQICHQTLTLDDDDDHAAAASCWRLIICITQNQLHSLWLIWTYRKCPAHVSSKFLSTDIHETIIVLILSH